MSSPISFPSIATQTVQDLQHDEVRHGKLHHVQQRPDPLLPDLGPYPAGAQAEATTISDPPLPVDESVTAAVAAACWRRRKASYSLTALRRSSSDMTSRMTPMHDPANMPVDVIFHDDEMKQLPVVDQFHNIWNATC